MATRIACALAETVGVIGTSCRQLSVSNGKFLMHSDYYRIVAFVVCNLIEAFGDDSLPSFDGIMYEKWLSQQSYRHLDDIRHSVDLVCGKKWDKIGQDQVGLNLRYLPPWAVRYYLLSVIIDPEDMSHFVRTPEEVPLATSAASYVYSSSASVLSDLVDQVKDSKHSFGSELVHETIKGLLDLCTERQVCALWYFVKLFCWLNNTDCIYSAKYLWIPYIDRRFNRRVSLRMHKTRIEYLVAAGLTK